jgi:hypothetical protein
MSSKIEFSGVQEENFQKAPNPLRVLAPDLFNFLPGFIGNQGSADWK